MTFLRSSCQQFDDGRREFAQLVATHLRVLLHDRPPGSHALLAQLDALDAMEFFDSGGEVDPANLLTSSTLTLTRMTAAGAYHVPKLDSFGPRQPGEQLDPMDVFLAEQFEQGQGRSMLVERTWRPFTTWWHMPVVSDDQAERFSRSDIVKHVANQDGGAHVDAGVPERYGRLSRSNSLGWSWSTGSAPDVALGNPVPAMVRQIGYELLLSIDRYFPDLREHPIS